MHANLHVFMHVVATIWTEQAVHSPFIAHHTNPIRMLFEYQAAVALRLECIDLGAAFVFKLVTDCSVMCTTVQTLHCSVVCTTVQTLQSCEQLYQ